MSDSIFGPFRSKPKPPAHAITSELLARLLASLKECDIVGMVDTLTEIARIAERLLELNRALLSGEVVEEQERKTLVDSLAGLGQRISDLQDSAIRSRPQTETLAAAIVKARAAIGG